MRFKRSQMSFGLIMLMLVSLIVSISAAGVLISRAREFRGIQTNAIDSSTSRLGHSLDFIEIFAEDGRDLDVEEFTMTTKLTPVAKSALLSDILISVTTQNLSRQYEYNSSIDCSNKSNTTPTSGYGAELIFNPKGHDTNFIDRGDILRICLEAPESTPAYEYVYIDVFPGFGTPNRFELRMPRTIVHQKIMLLP
ncbi:hypothetical protein H6503_02880 [Candidatus Woesearchaeota archaeon]|nr:hypothetical protein [Candidatus Woesearchaeota archaeon]